MTVAFERLADHIRARSGISLGPDKLYLVETRLAPILRREKLADLASLSKKVGVDDRLSRDVIEAMTTNESLFFRDHAPFQHVRSIALPWLHQVRPPGQKLRIWSAAASYGQEAYSLAMIALEVPGLLDTRNVEIIGTDISAGALDRARAGLYTTFEVQRGLSALQLGKYFQQERGQWRVGPALRSLISFKEWNLLSPLAALGAFDLVFCRNVLIYFDIDTKARVAASVCRQLAPDGFVYLGASETPMGFAANLTRADAGCSVYKVSITSRT